MKAKLLILLFLVSAVSYAGRYARYNQAGYEPLRKKRVIVMSDDNCFDFKWRIKDNGKIILNGTIEKSVTGAGDHTPKVFNHEIDFTSLNKAGTYSFEIDGVATFDVKVLGQPYAPITGEILHYLRSQRCGSDHAVDHKICHQGDKSCKIYRRNGNDNTSWSADKSKKSVNMSGGWHDAGDYIKFTLTTAYTTYFLLRSYEAYPELFNKKIYSKTDLVDVLDEAKWGLDYLMKTMPDSTEFIIQAGGWQDHEVGNRLPERDALDGERECYSALSPTHMAYTAAALAIGANIFKSAGKIEEAKKYEEMAKQIYRIALLNDKNESIAWFEKDFKFYADDTKNDNMQLASMELYLLTKEKNYLEKANLYSSKTGAASWAAWPSLNMIAHHRLLPYNNSVLAHMETDLDEFRQIAKEQNNIWGLPHKYTWATLYSFILVANSSMLHGDATKKNTYENMYLDVLDYTFGMNNWGVSMIASKNVPNSVKNIYSQVYKLQPQLFPLGAIAEGPGDNETHKGLMQYFSIDDNDPFHKFNTETVVFFDNNTDFQCMETTITGLADGLFMLTLASKMVK